METFEVTITIKSNADPSLILELAQAHAATLVTDLESYTYKAEADEADVCVEDIG